jgi:hypothetical protein
MKKLFSAALIGTLLVSWTLQTIELEKKKLFNNKVEILLPKSFTIMTEEMLQLKYPSQNRPKLVYTDEDGTVNIAFNHTTSRASQQLVEKYKEVMEATFKSTYPDAVWETNEIQQINGRKVGVIVLTTDAADTKIYNHLFYTDLEGRLLIGTFNCTVEKKPDWAATASKIVNSLRIK